jgi:uncharacterized protein
MKKLSLSILLMTLLLALLSSISFSYAYTSGHIGLLTVSESNNNSETGGIADLYLVIKPGSGRIFIDSFPLSKLDTQITMRFATEIACDLLDKDCSGYDFFYTITANSALVGGPSAGAAATVLTVGLLDNQILDNKTIMTGTINSGNLIGPVAGVPAKALAAQLQGYKRILIPEWDIVNNTPDKNLSIEVIPVSTLEEALYYFTGKNYSTNEDVNMDLVSSKEYSDMMSKVTLDLCTRYGEIINDTVVLPNLTAYGINVTNSTQDNFVLALAAINDKSYYSAASFCFGGNVKLRAKLTENLSKDDLKILYARLLGNISDFESKLEKTSKSFSTISELETYMIVKERLSDAKTVLSETNPENISSYQLAYATERFDTAVAWSRFSELPGQKYIMDNDLLKVVCTKKISEAEERLNYLETYYTDADIREELTNAYDYYNQGDYPLCIFTASKAKADSDVVLSAIFVPDNNTGRLFDEKINAAKIVIAKQEKSNIFPILGYSYYEYANTLKDTDKYSALLYAEYSLELSNLDMYFKKSDSTPLLPVSLVEISAIQSNIYVFLTGFFIGVIITIVVALLLRRSILKGKKKKR